MTLAAKTAARLGDWALDIPPPRAPTPGEKAVLWLPQDVPSMANARMHFRAKAHLTKRQRYQLAAAWVRLGLPRGHKPVSVTLTRVGARELDDDNLQGAMKAHRDQVAEMCGFNDREKLWTYAQDTGAEHGVLVEVTWA